MLQLTAAFKDFYVAGTSTTIPLPASWAQLVRAAMTVGRDAHWATRGVERTFLRQERVWRAAMMRACLRQSAAAPAARVVRTSAYATLDPSEKGAVSFFLGQATAKYVAEVMFGCVMFAHLDSALRHCGLPATGNRPDFIGLCADGRILVVEAKGRSGGLGGVLENAKSQLAGVSSGDLTYAHASYFRGTELRVALLDPEPLPASEVPLRGVLLAHYNPVRRILADGFDRPVGNTRYRVRPFDELGIELGLPVDLLEELDAVEARDLEPQGFLLRRRDRFAAVLVGEVPVQPADLRADQLRPAPDAGRDARSPVATDLPVQARSSEEARPSRGSRGRQQRIARRLRADPSLVDVSTRVTEARAVIGPDESFVALGSSWESREMSLEPGERGELQ